MNCRLGAALYLAFVRLTPFCIVQVTLLETFLTRGIVVLGMESCRGPSARPHHAVVNIETCISTYYMAEFITWAKVACPRHMDFSPWLTWTPVHRYMCLRGQPRATPQHQAETCTLMLARPRFIQLSVLDAGIEICFKIFYYMAEFITWAKVACPRHIGFVVDFCAKA